MMGSNKSNYKELQTCIAVKPQYCDGVNWMIKIIKLINPHTLWNMGVFPVIFFQIIK